MYQTLVHIKPVIPDICIQTIDEFAKHFTKTIAAINAQDISLHGSSADIYIYLHIYIIYGFMQALDEDRHVTSLNLHVKFWTKVGIFHTLDFNENAWPK